MSKKIKMQEAFILYNCFNDLLIKTLSTDDDKAALSNDALARITSLFNALSTIYVDGYKKLTSEYVLKEYSIYQRNRKDLFLSFVSKDENGKLLDENGQVVAPGDELTLLNSVAKETLEKYDKDHEDIINRQKASEQAFYSLEVEIPEITLTEQHLRSIVNFQVNFLAMVVLLNTEILTLK
jgi:hypothetical protein